MRIKKLVITVVCIALAVVEIFFIIKGFSRDKTGPAINIISDRIQYIYGCDDAALLSGIEARDAKDGDVSNTLVVSQRIVLSEKRLEAVTFKACDGSGNVTQRRVLYATEADGTVKILPYENYDVDMENMKFSVKGADITGDITQIQEIGTSGNDVPNDDTTGSPEDSTPDESTSAPEDTTTDESGTPVAIVSDGKPIIELTVNEITIKKGATVNWMRYVKDIHDDKDTYEYLSRRVSLTEEINTQSVGDFRQGLYCVDSERNVSETVYITVHITE